MKNTKELFLIVEILIEVANTLAIKKTITVPLKNIVSFGKGVVVVYKSEQSNKYTKYVFCSRTQYVEVSEASDCEVERMNRYRYKSYESLPRFFRKHVIQKLYR